MALNGEQRREALLKLLLELPAEIQSVRDELSEIGLEVKEKMGDCQDKVDTLFQSVYSVLGSVQALKEGVSKGIIDLTRKSAIAGASGGSRGHPAPPAPFSIAQETSSGFLKRRAQGPVPPPPPKIGRIEIATVDEVEADEEEEECNDNHDDIVEAGPEDEPQQGAAGGDSETTTGGGGAQGWIPNSKDEEIPRTVDMRDETVFHGSAGIEVNFKTKRYLCLCGKKKIFGFKAMVKHYLKRSLGKNFQCGRCSARFLLSKSLKEHSIFKHKVDAFPCKLCFHCFNSEGEHDRHMTPFQSECGRFMQQKINNGEPHLYLQCL